MNQVCTSINLFLASDASSCSPLYVLSLSLGTILNYTTRRPFSQRNSFTLGNIIQYGTELPKVQCHSLLFSLRSPIRQTCITVPYRHFLDDSPQAIKNPWIGTLPPLHFNQPLLSAVHRSVLLTPRDGATSMAGQINSGATSG